MCFSCRLYIHNTPYKRLCQCLFVVFTNFFLDFFSSLLYTKDVTQRNLYLIWKGGIWAKE
nr:MAG TPA: hypothetical protein [Caudoviricetes sp.]